MSYWKYYDPKFSWVSNPGLMDPDIEEAINEFAKMGFSSVESKKLVESGFVFFSDNDLVIDRYYGGFLSSYNFKNRFPVDSIKEVLDSKASSPVWVRQAKSLSEVESIVSDFNKGNNVKHLFRGQNENFTLKREINNPNYVIPQIGEVSLIPSLWRAMLNNTHYYYREFENLSLFEWSHILYGQFNLEDIKRREQELAQKGELIFTMSDMEDCSDPILREFGKFRVDLAVDLDVNLATTLSTMLQHYGLYSPVLDLSSSFDVAMFFATHQFEKTENIANYKFIGTNNGKSVIYVIRENIKEMARHDHENFAIKYFEPLRPLKQHCAVVRSGAYAINLAADFLEGVIFLDFELSENDVKLSQADLFPTEHQDKFLGALKRSSNVMSNITEFTL